MLDCDDLWTPEKLEKQMRFLEEHPDFRAVHSAVKLIDHAGRERLTPKSDIRFDDLVKFPCAAFPSAVVMQREALFECGLFNPTKRACQDLDLFLRFTSQYPIGCINEPLVIRRVLSDGLSRNLPTFWHEADRVYRDYRYVFSDQTAAANTLVDLSADFLLDAVYARDADIFWNVLGGRPARTSRCRGFLAARRRGCSGTGGIDTRVPDPIATKPQRSRLFSVDPRRLRAAGPAGPFDLASNLQWLNRLPLPPRRRLIAQGPSRPGRGAAGAVRGKNSRAGSGRRMRVRRLTAFEDE